MTRIDTSRKLAVPGFVIDLAVYAAILLLGVVYFRCYLNTPDFTLDAMYPELARSIIEKGAYVFDFLPETMLPPGFPMLLALVHKLGGVSPAMPYHVVAVFATLGLLATYELLRRAENRAVAAAICLLLGTSQVFFLFVTSMIFAEMPYFFFSMVVLLLAWKMDRSRPGKAQIGRILLLSTALVLSLMTRSVGVALLLGLSMWIAVPIFKNCQLVRSRVIAFIIPLILGVVAQGLWSEWAKRRQIEEWSLGGWPQSYTSQLLVKNGNDPELGTAHLGDIPARVATNITGRAAEISYLLMRRETGTQFWSSPLIVGLIVLIGLGLFTSIWREGGELCDWYFVCHEAIFLLWPWTTETRFVLPIVPLAWLYLWRGGKVLKSFSKRQPQVAGLAFVLVGAVLAFASVQAAITGDEKRWQAMLAVLFWVLLAVIGCAMLALRSVDSSPRFRGWASLKISDTKSIMPARAVLILPLAALLGYGCVLELETARHNANPEIQGPWYPDIAAAEWIQAHEPPDQVVMARKQDLVFHYTRHRVVWFPPISDPKRLMEGIRQHDIGVVVVVSRKNSYWQPPDDVCFSALQRTYPSSFQLLHSGNNYWIYGVRPPESGMQQLSQTDRAFSGFGPTTFSHEASVINTTVHQLSSGSMAAAKTDAVRGKR